MPKSTGGVHIKFLSITLALFLLGCSTNHSNRIYENTNLKEIEFLQYTKTQQQWMEALATGELELKNSCLSFKGDTSSIVFPASFYLDHVKGKVVIKKGNKIVGIVGQKVSTGGGWVNSIDHLPITKPVKCKGNGYFIVGQGFKLI